MRFTVAVLAFALGAMAHPSPQNFSPPIGNDVTIGQAGDRCGQDLQLSCCNKVKQVEGSQTEASGLLAGLLGGALENADVDIFDGCSKLTVTARKSISNHICQKIWVLRCFPSYWRRRPPQQALRPERCLLPELRHPTGKFSRGTATLT
jgi:hypothetical protein